MSNFPTSLDDDNSLYLAANQVSTNLNGALASSGGNNGQSDSVDLIDASALPTTSGFILVELELIKYTTRATNKLTGITRGYGNTTARAHKSGSFVTMPVMADFHNVLKDAIKAIEAAIGVSGAEKYVKTFEQATDPSLVAGNSVKNGDEWNNTADGQAYKRIGGVWKMFA